MVGDQQRFNRDMDDYIRSRRREDKVESKSFSISFGGNKPGKKKVPEVEGDSIYVYDSNGEVGLWDQIVGFFLGTYEEEIEEEPADELSEQEMKKLKKMQGKEVKVEEVEDEEFKELDELDVPRPGFVTKLFQFLGFGEIDYNEYEEYPNIEDFDPDSFAQEESERLMWEEDVKEIIKIAHSWIEKLPAEKKKEFKASADFEKYRSLLDKLGLLKK